MPPPTPVILVPPSEGKAEGGDGPPVDWAGGAFGALADLRLQVRDAVRKALRDGGGEKLLGVRGAHLQRALAEWDAIDSSPTTPAARRYAGVVWGGLDLPSLAAPARRRAMARIVVPSGLWGLVAAGDPLPPYRLKMGARVPGIGLLAPWWRPVVTPALAERARRGCVIDLLPQEHRQAIDASALRPGCLVRVHIVEDGPGGRASVGHAGKQVKGRLARAIVEHDARTADDVAGVRAEGLELLSVDPGEVVEVTFLRNA